MPATIKKRDLESGVDSNTIPIKSVSSYDVNVIYTNTVLIYPSYNASTLYNKLILGHIN